MFGGSGLLSHTAKQIKPKATVIYNDFDDYFEHLKHLHDTNRLRQQIYALVSDLPRNKRFPDKIKIQYIEIIKNFDEFVDLQTVATWLLFSGQ